MFGCMAAVAALHVPFTSCRPTLTRHFVSLAATLCCISQDKRGFVVTVAAIVGAAYIGNAVLGAVENLPLVPQLLQVRLPTAREGGSIHEHARA